MAPAQKGLALLQLGGLPVFAAGVTFTPFVDPNSGKQDPAAELSLLTCNCYTVVFISLGCHPLYILSCLCLCSHPLFLTSQHHLPELPAGPVNSWFLQFRV